MRLYRDEEELTSVAIIFDAKDSEIELGLGVAEDLIELYRQRGGTEAPDLRQWINETRAMFLHPTIN